MSRADKKRRREAKREAKRYDARRRASVSPVKRLADAPGEVECWISEDVENLGQVQIFCFKRAAGISGIACFLVDVGVVGLKDAWTQTRVDRVVFDDMLARCRDQGINMRRGSLEEVRRWVAGGARWAHDNGMRLPRDWQKTAAVIGGVGDWMSAVVSSFVKEFAGHPEDLRQRLIGQSFESYVERDDIDFIFSEDAPYMDQRTGDYVHADALVVPDEVEEWESIAGDIPIDELNEMAAELSTTAGALDLQTRAWLAARGETPSPELLEAWRSILLVAMLSQAAMPDAPRMRRAEFSNDLLADVTRRLEPDRAVEHGHAVEQIEGHLRADPAIIQRVVPHDDRSNA